MADAPASHPFLSAHARYAAHAARACGYGFRSLDGADGYLFEVSDGARRAVFAAGAGSPYALNDANAASIARDKAFCAAVLGERGIAAIPGRLFFVTTRWADMRAPGREPEDALAFAAGASYPLFCKPIAASNGVFAERIENAAAFKHYMERVEREHFAILAQPFVSGDEYRVLVLQGQVLFSYRKQPPNVIGDGVSDVASLAQRAGATGHDAFGRFYASDGVPEAGQSIALHGPANRAAGGSAERVKDGAPALLARLATAAADAIGLKLAGIDIFDVSPNRDLTDLMVIEVNSNPMIATLEDQGRWDLIEMIWRLNFGAALR